MIRWLSCHLRQPHPILECLSYALTLLQLQLPANACPGRQQMLAHVFELLCEGLKTGSELLVSVWPTPDLQAFGDWNCTSLYFYLWIANF